MTRIRATMTLVILLIALAATPLWGCGRYGPPVRPEKPAPAKPAPEHPAQSAPEANPSPVPQDEEEEKPK